MGAFFITDIITVISDIVKHFLSNIPNFLVFFPQPPVIATLRPLLLAIQFRHEHDPDGPVYEALPSSGGQRNAVGNGHR
jgi:hypothetical protein